jgi:VWFA-related protein
MRFGRAAVLAFLPVAAVLVVSLRQAPAVHAENYARTATRFAEQQPIAAPTLKVYSRETIVDVTVTDSKGNPVHGLTRDDFTIKEDGKPQPIKSFAEFGTQPAKPLPKLPPNTYTNLQPQADGPVNIMLLDFLNVASLPGLGMPGAEDAFGRSLAAQRAVKREAQKYVATMRPGTRVMVLGLGSNLRTLQGITSEPSLLSAALDTFDYNTEGQVSTYNQFCAQAEMRVRMTMEALNQIASSTSGIKGKKNLLWFSVGIPWLTDPSARAECLPDYNEPLLKVYGLLTAAQIAIYPIDARGVPTMPNAFITSTGVLWAGIPQLPAPAYIKATQDWMTSTAEQHLAMEDWAEKTGGAAFYNSNDLASLIGKDVDAGANYYTLSYVPPGGYNWAHHGIKVVLDKPGLHLVYRESYDAVDPATIKPAPELALANMPESTGPVDMRTEMARAMPTSTALLFDVEVAPAAEPAKPTDPQVIGVLATKLKDKPLTRYSFTYGLPGRQIAFTNGLNGTHHGSLEFDLAAYDGEGNVVTSLRQAIQLNLTAEQAVQLAQSPFRYFQQLDLPPGALFLRVGILDRTSNKVGTLEIPLTVAKQLHTAEK